MRNLLRTAVFGGLSAIILAGCSTPKTIPEVSEEKSLPQEIPPTAEKTTVYDAPDNKLLRRLTGNFDRGATGRLFLYGDNRVEIEFNSGEGEIYAVDYDNNGSFDKINSKGALENYATNEFLSRLRDEIIRQNR